MQAKGKWLVRGGSILALVAFFLPGVMVSCSVPGTGGFLSSSTSYSLADLANEAFIKQGFLFLVPILLLLTLIFSFLPMSANSELPKVNWSLLGQAASCAGSIATIVISLMALSRQANSVGQLPFSTIDLSKSVEFQPEAGLFIFLAGYLSLLVGLVLQAALPTRQNRPVSGSYRPTYAQNAMAPPAQAVCGCHLELFQPGRPLIVLPLQGDHFMLGRGEGSDFVISDLTVSRQHAFLYFAGGGWNIEDRGSAAGILVNGRAVHAASLAPGDQIQLGRVVLILKDG